MLLVILHPGGFGGKRLPFLAFTLRPRFQIYNSVLAGKGNALAFGSHAFTF